MVSYDARRVLLGIGVLLLDLPGLRARLRGDLLRDLRGVAHRDDANRVVLARVREVDDDALAHFLLSFLGEADVAERRRSCDRAHYLDEFFPVHFLVSLRVIHFTARRSVTNASSAFVADLMDDPGNALGGRTFAASPITSANSLPRHRRVSGRCRRSCPSARLCSASPTCERAAPSCPTSQACQRTRRRISRGRVPQSA